MNKKALLINPPIYDVQYWERWSLPHGLLRISSYLKENGYRVKLIDCLKGESHRRVKSRRRSVVELGSGKEIDLKSFSGNLTDKLRYKSCYGLSIEELEKQFENLWSDRMLDFGIPDEIWITSIMTYWWESTRDVISSCKKFFPNAKIRVGGIYPTLAPDHSKNNLGLGNPIIINGNELDLKDKIQQNSDLIVSGEIPEANDLWLDLDIYTENGGAHPDYTILTTSRGCPRDCEYCAAYLLSGKKVRMRDVDSVLDEIRELYDKGIREFCFYEDNLLMSKKSVMDLFDNIASDETLKGIELFTPEGLEIRLIDQELANIMVAAGFKRVYLPLESIDHDNLQRFKRNFYSLEHFEKAVKCFENAGFTSPQQINTFILFGLPGEDLQSVYDTAVYASNRTGSIIPMLFSPVPSTPLFSKLEDYINEFQFDLHQLNGKLLPFLEYNRRALSSKYEITHMDYKNLESFMFRMNQKLSGNTFRFGSQSRVGKAFRKMMLSKQDKSKSLIRNSRKEIKKKGKKLISEYHGSIS